MRIIICALALMVSFGCFAETNAPYYLNSGLNGNENGDGNITVDASADSTKKHKPNKPNKPNIADSNDVKSNAITL